MTSKKSLYDIPSLPDALLKQKYRPVSTSYYDPNTVSNFMKDMIRNTGPDAPIFEQDLPRRSGHIGGQSLLMMQEHGSRYTHTPYHPELFLGDLSKDQRMSTTEPRTSQMVEQNKFRQIRYIKGKLQDVGDVRSEGMIGTKRMIQQVKQGLNNTATRMRGIFDDSTGNMVARTNPNPGNSTHKVGDVLKEDQTIYQIGDEKILPQYGHDVVSKLSNLIGAQWQSQPDAKVGLSSVSNVYRSKQEVDRAANAVFRLGSQDTQFKTETTDVKSGTAVPKLESFKQARKDRQNVVVQMKKDSVKSKRMTALLPAAPVNHVDMFVGTQSVKSQLESKTQKIKHAQGNKIPESLVEPIKSNNTTVNQITVSMPVKDKLAIVRLVDRTQKSSHSNEGYAMKNSGIKALANAFTKKADTFQEQKSKDGYQSTRYVNGIPVKAVDHVSNNKMTKSKFAPTKEYAMANPTGSNAVPVPSNTDSFRFDTDPTMNNNYITRRGLTQRGTNITMKQEYDNEISPLTDSVNPYRTKY